MDAVSRSTIDIKEEREMEIVARETGGCEDEKKESRIPDNAGDSAGCKDRHVKVPGKDSFKNSSGI